MNKTDKTNLKKKLQRRQSEQSKMRESKVAKIRQRIAEKIQAGLRDAKAMTQVMERKKLDNEWQLENYNFKTMNNLETPKISITIHSDNFLHVSTETYNKLAYASQIYTNISMDESGEYLLYNNTPITPVSNIRAIIPSNIFLIFNYKLNHLATCPNNYEDFLKNMRVVQNNINSFQLSEFSDSAHLYLPGDEIYNSYVQFDLNKEDLTGIYISDKGESIKFGDLQIIKKDRTMSMNEFLINLKFFLKQKIDNEGKFIVYLYSCNPGLECGNILKYSDIIGDHFKYIEEEERNICCSVNAYRKKLDIKNKLRWINYVMFQDNPEQENQSSDINVGPSYLLSDVINNKTCEGTEEANWLENAYKFIKQDTSSENILEKPTSTPRRAYNSSLRLINNVWGYFSGQGGTKKTQKNKLKKSKNKKSRKNIKNQEKARKKSRKKSRKKNARKRRKNKIKKIN